MLKRDSITAQMQQLSDLLAKVKRLIVEDHEEEARKVTQATFLDYFRMQNEDLMIGSDEQFNQKLNEEHYKAEELDMLAYFIDEYAGIQDELSHQLILYRRYLQVISYLESTYQLVSFEHTIRRDIIQNQLSRLQ